MYKDKYLALLINKIFRRIIKAKAYTKLDIRHVFYRIRIHPELKEFTVFKTYYGAYQYKVMPFGLYNKPVIF